MIRQSAFGIALSMLVLASGFTTTHAPGHTSTKKRPGHQNLSMSSDGSASYFIFNTAELEKSVFDQINRYRLSLGLPKLTLSEKITKQARIHSQNMANGKVPFSHQGFEQRVNAIPIAYSSAAENVAFNQGYSDPAAEAIHGWLRSREHLNNIKGDYDLTGIGVAVNAKGEVYLTQIFLKSDKR